MDRPRFVFVSAVPAGRRTVAVRRPPGVAWLLMSPNNRGLGRGTTIFASFGGCHDAVERLRREHATMRGQVVADETTGHFTWRVDLGAGPVAVSSRSYLRARESEYNLARFLDAVPRATIAERTRDTYPMRVG